MRSDVKPKNHSPFLWLFVDSDLRKGRQRADASGGQSSSVIPEAPRVGLPGPAG